MSSAISTNAKNRVASSLSDRGCGAHTAVGVQSPPLDASAVASRDDAQFGAVGAHVDYDKIAKRVAAFRAIERHALVAEAAYFRAEKRGFAPGHEHEDWFEAEAAIAALEREGGSTATPL